MWVALAIFLSVLAGFAIYIFASGPKLSPETEAIIERVLHSEPPEIITGKTGFARSAGLKIWYELIAPEGSSKGTVLLIMANGGGALNWPVGFVRAFVDAGYQVIRYDHRGTGMSDRVEDWDRRNPYSIADMAQDALAVLDAAGIRAAHLIGLSMGGMIAQEIAIQHPTRTATLNLIMTSGHIGDPQLPGLTSRYFWKVLFTGLPLMKYRILGGEKNLIRERIAKQSLAAGSETLDVQETAEAVLYDLRKRRGINIQAAFQHQAAVQNSGARYDRLKNLTVPTLVIHGTEDAIIPLAHGKKLAELIPNAQGFWLEGVGHTFPVPDMGLLVRTICAHLERSVS